MRNLSLSILIVAGLAGFSFGGDCPNGLCNRPSNAAPAPSKVVQKEIVKVPAAPLPKVNSCPNGKCYRSRRVIRVR